MKRKHFLSVCALLAACLILVSGLLPVRVAAWFFDSDEPVVTNQQELMAVIGLGMLELREEIRFKVSDGFDVSGEQLPDAFEALRDRYYLAYMGYHGYTGSTTSYAGVTTDVEITVNYYEGVNLSKLGEWRDETETQLLALSGSLFAADMPDAEVLLRIHDYIVNNTKYNSADMDDPGNYMAYGCLVRGSCVCQGYAEAFRLLCQAAGIDARYVTGIGSNDLGTESHGWNAVLLDGEWYMVDVTWDDPLSTTGEDILRYDYFLVTGDQLAKDHSWDVQAFPICSGTTWNADAVLAQYGQSAQQYTQYRTDNVMTQSRIREELTAILNAGMQFPTEEPAPTQEQQVTEPAIVPTTPTQKPAYPAQNTENEGSPILWIVLVLAIVLLAAAGAAVIFLRERNTRSRRRAPMAASTWSSSRPNVQDSGRSGRSRDLPGSKW